MSPPPRHIRAQQTRCADCGTPTWNPNRCDPCINEDDMRPDPMNPWQPLYHDDTDLPDPFDGGYVPQSWSRERAELAAEEHAADRMAGAFDEAPAR